MTPLRFLVRKRSPFNQVTRGLDLNLRSRLRQVFSWLLVLTVLHTAAMMAFESLAWDDALWLTLTTLTTVGYGDLSAATPAGRVATVLLLYVAGITLLAQLASDYIDHRLKRKEHMLKGRWRWQMKDHLVIVNSPKHSPALYFERLVEQLHATEQFADIPVLILTDVFPDGLPASLREQGVVHYHAESSDRDALEAVTPDQAKAVIVLARDEYSRISDSVTLDVILQLKALYGDALPYTVAECVHEDNRRRALSVGASTTLRPVRAYPEMLVRSLVAPGTEKILENLFTHHDDHAMRYRVPVRDAVWADVACRLMNNGLGTLMAYVSDDETVVCHPAHDHRFSADSLILMVRAEAIPAEQAVRHCLVEYTE